MPLVRRVSLTTGACRRRPLRTLQHRRNCTSVCSIRKDGVSKEEPQVWQLHMLRIDAHVRRDLSGLRTPTDFIDGLLSPGSEPEGSTAALSCPAPCLLELRLRRFEVEDSQLLQKPPELSSQALRHKHAQRKPECGPPTRNPSV